MRCIVCNKFICECYLDTNLLAPKIDIFGHSLREQEKTDRLLDDWRERKLEQQRIIDAQIKKDYKDKMNYMYYMQCLKPY